MKTRLRLEFIKKFVKDAIPEYRNMLSEIEKDGGHFQMPPEINLLIERLKIENYPEYYRDEPKLTKLLMLSSMPAEQINAISEEIALLEGEEKVLAQEEFIAHLTSTSIQILDTMPATKEEAAASAELFNSLSPEDQEKALLQTQIALSAFIPIFYQVMTIMVHGRKLSDLVLAAEAGDDEAFCLAVQMDKRIMALPYFRERRNKAELNQETDFLKSLNYRLTNPLLRGKIRYKMLWLTFAVLDMSGYLDGSLKLREILDFCEKVGVVGVDNPIQDESALGKRLREYRQFQKINQTSRH